MLENEFKQKYYEITTLMYVYAALYYEMLCHAPECKMGVIYSYFKNLGFFVCLWTCTSVLLKVYIFFHDSTQNWFVLKDLPPQPVH